MKAHAAWLAIALLVPAAARADDWLAVLPACETPARAGVPTFAFVYPRPGLPALVEAGDTLVARVRLPSPLTPPPGVQQPRALAGWHAALIGHALPWPPPAELEQRHALEVTNVRPDGASSLVYRASLPIPAWLAPGTYDLELTAPGGSDRARNLVRVLENGSVARLAWSSDAPPAAATLALDLLVRTDTDTDTDTATGPPQLQLDSLVAAFRIGSRLWVIGECGDRFAADVASVLERERRSRIEVHAPVEPGSGYAPWGATSAAWQAWPGEDALRIERDADSVRVARGPAAPDAEIALVFASDGRGVASNAGRLRFYPAAAIDRAQPPAITALLNLAAGQSAVLTRTRTRTHSFRLIAEPSVAQSGARVLVRALSGTAPALRGGASLSDDPGARVAFHFDALHSAFAQRQAEHAYPELGEQRIAALAIASDGVATPLETRVEVRATQGDGCRCSLAGERRARPAWLALAPLYLVRLAVRRKRAKKRRPAGEQE